MTQATPPYVAGIAGITDNIDNIDLIPTGIDAEEQAAAGRVAVRVIDDPATLAKVRAVRAIRTARVIRAAYERHRQRLAAGGPDAS